MGNNAPRCLVFDIETSPILSYTWGIWEQNVGLNQIVSDWHLLAWSAKWLGDSPNKVMYQDQRNAKNVEDDTALLKSIWNLLNEADIVITQNGKKFDQKKLNARFILMGLKPPKPFKHIDTYEQAKKHFGFTSNRLEYLTAKLCKKYKKLSHKKFPGFELWKACLAGNKKAWDEMKEYSIHDVLSLEELYLKMQGWIHGVDFNLYRDGDKPLCNCGGKNLRPRGYAYTPTGKFRIYNCKDCGKWPRGRTNLLSQAGKKALLK